MPPRRSNRARPTLGDLISQALGQHRSQAWLAQRCGVSRSMVSQWISGKSGIGLGNLAAVVCCLDLDANATAEAAGYDPHDLQLALLARDQRGGGLLELARSALPWLRRSRMLGSPSSAEALTDSLASQVQACSRYAPQLHESQWHETEALLRYEHVLALQELRLPGELVAATREDLRRMDEIARGYPQLRDLPVLADIARGIVHYVAREYAASKAFIGRALAGRPSAEQSLIGRRVLALDAVEMARTDDMDIEEAQREVLRSEERIIACVEEGHLDSQHFVCMAHEGIARARGRVGLDGALDRLEDAVGAYQVLVSQGQDHTLLPVQIARSRAEILAVSPERDELAFEETLADGRRAAQHREGARRYAQRFDELLREFTTAQPSAISSSLN